MGTGCCLSKTMFWTKICEGLGQGSIWKKCATLRIFATVESSNFKFGTQLGFGTSLPKNNVKDQNWRGSGPGEYPENFGTSYLFLQPLKIATSNLVYNLGLGLACQKTTFRTKIGGELGQGSIRKKWGPAINFCNRWSSRLKNWYPTWVQVCLAKHKLYVGSELRKYHSPPNHDDDATVYSTCRQKTDGYPD